MNDAGGEGVQDHAQALEKEGRELPKRDVENDNVHLDPTYVAFFL